MPLENATTINQLDSQWPAGGDTADKGDDHIRLIKSVLKQTFPGPPPGNGFDTPVTVDPKLLNELATKLTNMETAIKNAHPVGDVILRLDNTDPGTLYPGTTWQRVTADACLSFADANGSNVGTTSGNNNPVVPVPAHNHSASSGPAGDHGHGYQGYGNAGTKQADGGGGNDVPRTTGWSNMSTGQSGPHAHPITVDSAGTAGATLDVRGARMYFSVWKRVA